jgi:hypothetical protein
MKATVAMKAVQWPFFFSEVKPMTNRTLSDEYCEKTEDDQEKAFAKLSELCDALAKSGVTAVTLAYDDEGCVDATHFDPNDVPVSAEIVEGLKEAVSAFAPKNSLLDGSSFGEVALDVVERYLEQVHSICMQNYDIFELPSVNRIGENEESNV